jgi:hypothetical protein
VSNSICCVIFWIISVGKKEGIIHDGTGTTTKAEKKIKN